MSSEITDKSDAFRQISQLKLTKILDSIPGKKDLIIDGSVMKTLEKFIGVKLLRSHGVDKIFKLTKKEIVTDNTTLVYLVRADLITIKRVCDQYSSKQQNHIIVIPNVFHSIEAFIEEEGLYERVKLHSFNWELTNLDAGVLSFECPEIFKFFFVARDSTFTTPIARSLWSMEHIFGKIPFKMFLGPYSKSISSIMNILEEDNREPDSFNPAIGFLLVVDRDIDYASVLLTAGTYTSLVGDVLGINTGVVEIKKPSDDKQATAMPLSSEDETYNHIKHRNFSEVCIYLRQKVNEIKAFQAKRMNMTLHEMTNFVKKELTIAANKGKTVANHLHICEQIMENIGHLFEGIQTCQHDILMGLSRKECFTFIEELIASTKNRDLILRLACLLSISQNGLSNFEANSLKMQFLHAYGHEHLVTFYNLEKMGLFTCMHSSADSTVNLASKVVQAVSLPRKSAFKTTAEKLKLFPEVKEDYNMKDPQDSGYVFGGLYIPVIVQIVSLVINKEVKTLQELLKKLPNEGIDAKVIGKSGENSLDINPRCVFVYVVGGITYAEMAAFSLIEKKTGYRIVCSGSSIINGNILVQSAVQ